MKSLSRKIFETRADDADLIAQELEAASLEELVDFKFDKDTLFARDQDIVDRIVTALGQRWKVTPSEDARKKDRFIKIKIC